ncbi:MAG: complex I NDUFA9 subunit family protein [Nitrospirota bacterium]
MILITGGTGFVGRHLVRRLIDGGYKVRCLVRESSKVEVFKGLDVEFTFGDITDYNSLEIATKDAKTVIHLVGIIQETEKATFLSIHVKGTESLLKASLKNGVKLFLYQSALGADRNSPLGYHRTKADAETLVKESGIPYIIFRPSLIFGQGDQFTIRLSSIIRKSPVVPVIGTGEARFQPIYIEDWVTCAIKALNDSGMHNKVFEFGGPEHLTYPEIIDILAEALKIQRYKIYIPLHVMSPLVKIIENILPKPPVTTEQLLMLQQDNIADLKSVEKNFGFMPISLKEGVKGFLKGKE